MTPAMLFATAGVSVVIETPRREIVRRLNQTLEGYIPPKDVVDQSHLDPGDHFLFWNAFETEDGPSEIPINLSAQDHRADNGRTKDYLPEATDHSDEGLQKDGYSGLHAPPDHLWEHRLWTSGTLTYVRPIILDKQGICFEITGSVDIMDQHNCEVTTWRYIYQDDLLALVEKRVLLYTNTDYVARQTQSSLSKMGQIVTEITPSDVMLFRYSALTSNAHRIHYDRAYAHDVEKYPDLLVQGSLSVTLALRSCHAQNDGISSCSYQMVSPCLVGETLQIRHRAGKTGSRALISGKISQRLKVMLTIRN